MIPERQDALRRAESRFDINVFGKALYKRSDPVGVSVMTNEHEIFYIPCAITGVLCKNSHKPKSSTDFMSISAEYVDFSFGDDALKLHYHNFFSDFREIQFSL